MKNRPQRASVLVPALVACALLLGLALGLSAQEPSRRNRVEGPPMPPNPAEQRLEMIQVLKSIDARLKSMDERLARAEKTLEAIERHERQALVLLGNQ